MSSRSVTEARNFLAERRETIEKILIGRVSSSASALMPCQFFWDPQEHWDQMSFQGMSFSGQADDRQGLYQKATGTKRDLSNDRQERTEA